MSIKVMTRVWENSSARGGELLVLLAIADHADDRGFAWPGVDLLARKSRQTARHVTRCLHALEAAGELQVQRNAGLHGTNLYRVLCFGDGGLLPALPAKCQGDTPCRGDRRVLQMSPEPSEPSEPPTHTREATVVAVSVSEWPSEEEALQHARTYPGNPTSGILAGAITDDWARDYWCWRTFDEERWPQRWREEMFRRFEREWRDGQPAARGSAKKTPARAAAGGKTSPWAPPAPLSGGPVDLNKMRVEPAEPQLGAGREEGRHHE